MCQRFLFLFFFCIFFFFDTMSARGSGNSSTALRRLMTEYKQLTSGGVQNPRFVSFSASRAPPRFPRWHVYSRCAHPPSNPKFGQPPRPGPISESDFFTWEALICGPKDTPFVRPFSTAPAPSSISSRTVVSLSPNSPLYVLPLTNASLSCHLNSPPTIPSRHSR